MPAGSNIYNSVRLPLSYMIAASRAPSPLPPCSHTSAHSSLFLSPTNTHTEPNCFLGACIETTLMDTSDKVVWVYPESNLNDAFEMNCNVFCFGEMLLLFHGRVEEKLYYTLYNS